MNDASAEVRDFWNRTALDWDLQVGDEGDANRRLNSDPVLWRFLGDVAGRRVLDAGCGTGYLSRKLAERGATVIGVDISEKMIEIARSKGTGIDYRVDSVSELESAEDGGFDLVVSNYVLMDAPNLPGAVRAFHRVLRPGGAAIVVFSHPCFPRAAEPTHRTGRRATGGTSPTSSIGGASTHHGATSDPTSSGSTGRSPITGGRSGRSGSMSWTSTSRGSRPRPGPTRSPSSWRGRPEPLILPAGDSP